MDQPLSPWMIALKYTVIILFLPAIVLVWLMQRIFGEDFDLYVDSRSAHSPAQADTFEDDDFGIEDARPADDPIRWEEGRHHFCNVDGTPMLDDYVDMNGNAFGCTSVHEL